MPLFGSGPETAVCDEWFGRGSLARLGLKGWVEGRIVSAAWLGGIRNYMSGEPELEEVLWSEIACLEDLSLIG